VADGLKIYVANFVKFWRPFGYKKAF